MITLLMNHLWQSTLFAAVAGLLTLVLKTNPARTRYWIWLAASMKFLIPFSLLIGLGSHFEWRTAQVGMSSRAGIIAVNFASPLKIPAALPLSPVSTPAAASRIPEILISIWLCGFVAFLAAGLIAWARVRRIARSASEAWSLDLPVRVMSSSALLEPGVFGIFRPILLLPEGIEGRLTSEELRAILAHEMCHVRRRDNLTSAIHMAVEAIFWFHPLVWWIGARLVEERERACDEEVIRSGSEPQIYAKGILKVCEFYLESPLACVAGVTGSNLKKRIETIMTHRISHQLHFAKKIVLGAAGITAVAGPILIGIIHAPGMQAQAAIGALPRFEVASVRSSVRGTSQRPTDGSKSGDAKAPSLEFLVAHRRVVIPNFNLFALVVHAYGLRSCRPFGGSDCALLSGGPDWLRRDQFTIVAKMPDDSPDYNLTLPQFQHGQGPQLQLMLQALLADRFHLRIHREVKQLPVFALTVGEKGPKVKNADTTEEPRVMFRPSAQQNGHEMIQLVVQNSSMQELADMLSVFMDRPVIDQTRLKDHYDFRMEYEVNADAPGPFSGATGPELFTAFREQAGLKLEAVKGPVEILVIDHVERPSEN